MNSIKYDLIVCMWVYGMFVRMCVCFCVHVCVCVCVCTCRIGQNVLERSPEVDNVPGKSQQPALQDGHNYSTVDDMHQGMLAISGNPAYKFVPEDDQKPMQEDDQAYVNMDISQQGEVATCGKLGYGTQYSCSSCQW